MKKRIQISCAVLAAIMLVGCGSSSAKYDVASESASADYYAAEEAAYMDYSDSDSYEVTSNGDAQAEEVTEGATTNRKLIRTLNLSVETYDFDELTAAIPGKVAALGGYIESSSVDGNNNSYSRDASYTVRIPAAAADQFVSVLDGKSNITHQSESVEDVTLSYVDIQSRKESLQIEYDRLQEMLGEADTVEDMIYIEDRLSNVRYEIQSIESQLRSYDNKVDYTTIYLNINEVKEYTEPEPVDDSMGARIKRGLEDASDNIVDFLVNLVVVLVVAIPYLIMVAIVIGIPALIIIAIAKKCQKKSALKAQKKAAEAQAKVEDASVEAAQTEVGAAQADDTQAQEN